MYIVNGRYNFEQQRHLKRECTGKATRFSRREGYLGNSSRVIAGQGLCIRPTGGISELQSQTWKAKNRLTEAYITTLNRTTTTQNMYSQTNVFAGISEILNWAETLICEINLILVSQDESSKWLLLSLNFLVIF